MVIFDQLRISDKGDKMFIDVHINKADYFKDIYLDSITIIPADKVLESSPDIPSEDYLYQKTFGKSDSFKEASLVLTANDFTRKWETNPKKIIFKGSDMSSTLFFVYVKCKGTVGECTPCKLDELITLGVTFDEKMLYQKVMGYTKELTDDCIVPRDFIDFILRWYGFKASIESEHYIEAIKFWKMLFNDYPINETSYSIGCSCRK